ncbi:MAG: acetyl-CoA carboxylase biotin carboxyl carrier protein, partial [Nitrospirales bacterium]
GVRIRIRRDLAPVVSSTSVEHVSPVTAAVPTLTDSQSPVMPVDKGKFVTVASPIVGTFYRSPSPDADAYVEEGDFVKKGQVLCIVEAMKLMNEIEAETDGRIVKILLESTTPVEYGQPLFLLDPIG